MSWSFGDTCPFSNRDEVGEENALEPRTLVESEGPSQKLEEQQEPSLGNTTDTSVAPNVHEDDTVLTPLVSMIASCDVEHHSESKPTEKSTHMNAPSVNRLTPNG